MTTINDIQQALAWRYAVKIFDPAKPLAEDLFQAILEAGRLSPSSTGFEPWKFLVIENPEVRKRLQAVGYGQPKIVDAPKLVVIAARTDMREHGVSELIDRTAAQQGVSMESLEAWKKIAEGTIGSKDDAYLPLWAKMQCYIPLGMMLETAALLGVDAGPMEGFDPKGVDEVLGLHEKNLSVATMIAFGYRGDDPAATRPKVRRTAAEVVEYIR
ncbi:NAD(P)H-dependent oxidoreductase [Patescibacteria group bacterium]|jgi:nitroreductase|nr:NAD(P)H-dependent oxidoreductase [Patescibacteria group bacterium]